jgi:hypothetical protein
MKDGHTLHTALWCDLETDTEKEAWLLLGRGYDTGVIASGMQSEVASAFRRAALISELLDYVQHDSWRCGYHGECHCGLNTITERFGLPAVPLPEKGDKK